MKFGIVFNFLSSIPVSYTHLFFVGKHPFHKFLVSLTEVEEHTLFAFLIQQFSAEVSTRSPVPVSYTHLSYRKTHDGASIGLDFGLKTYLTKSDGSKINSPLFFKRCLLYTSRCV